MIRRPPRSTQSRSSAASDVYKRQPRVLRVCGCALPIAITSAATVGQKSGCSLKGRKEKRNQPSIGSQRFPRTSVFVAWSITRSCAGASSTTTLSSSRRPASATSRGEDGVDSTITPRCRSRFMDSLSPRGELFPPQQQLPKFSSRNLPFPKVTDPEAPPLRPERHVPNSIATLRRRLIVKLVAILSRCPCCGAKKTKGRPRPNLKGRERRNL